MKWMNLPDEYSTDKSKFVIVPVEYEKDLTYGQGASKGCKEIIKASQHLEYYDEQFDCEAFTKGIILKESLELNYASPEKMVEKVSLAIKDEKEKFVIGLGGDHATTIGFVKGLEELHDDFSVISFDAHSDFRDSWNNSKFNHACISKQVSKKHSMLLIGIRSMDVDEAEELKQRDDVNIVYGWNFSVDKVKEQLKNLKQKVYITIDVDCFDPSFIRNTGTPEPGGLLWNQIIDTLKIIFKEKEVIGADIVEFAPNDNSKENFDSEAYALAKLVYKIIGLKICFE